MSLLPRRLRLYHFLLPVVLALIFFSMTGRTMRRAPWYEDLFWNAVSPPQKLFAAISYGISNSWHRYFALINVQLENDALKTKVAELEGRLIEMDEISIENKRLKGLLAYNDSIEAPMIAARVIANDPRAEFKTITINVGSSDGVKSLMPVVGPKGLVGKVGKTSFHTSIVMLITDPNSAVDGMVQRSRVRGLVVGSAWHTELRPGYYLTRLEYLSSASDIFDGDVMVTSGLDGVFPRGLPIGTVHNLRMSKYGVFREANIVPFEDMSELQEVLIIMSETKEP